MRGKEVGKSAGMEKMGNVVGGGWGWGRWKSGSGGWRMEPWDGRCRLVGLASGSVYRKQMGYACSTPYFTRIYCLLFRVADDIGPCCPELALMSLIATPHRFHCHLWNRGSQIRDKTKPGTFFILPVNEYTSELGMRSFWGHPQIT